MKRIILNLIAGSLFFTSCERNSGSELDKVTDTTACLPQVCTEEFRFIQVKFVDAAYNPIIVKDFKVTNQRTKQLLVNQSVTDTVHAKGIYAVATDSNTHTLSEEGDTVLVSATHPNTGAKKESIFVIKGGRCACHITKVSGPDEVKF